MLLSKYDNVLRQLKNSDITQYRQFYADLKAVEGDGKIMRELATKFNFTEDQIKEFCDMTMKEYSAETIRQTKLFKEKPLETILIMCLFAGHGMINDGRQVLLINEFDKSKTFYKTIGAEENIRMAAQNFQNAYYVVIFACCREILLRSRHTGGMSKADIEQLLENERIRAK